MTRQTRSLLIGLLATVFFVLSSLLIIASLPSPGILILSFIVWLSIIIGCIVNARKVALPTQAIRIAATISGIFIIGIPFSLILLRQLEQHTTGEAAVLISFLCLAAWAIISGLCTRSAKGVYWSLHLAAWTAGLGLLFFAQASSYNDTGVPAGLWLLLPLGISIVLTAQYKAIIAFLSKRTIAPQPQLSNQPAPHASTTYEESGRVYGYPTYEQPKAQYPREMTQ